jgi:aspartyl-tRNA(Asn)/glutamyl-tRNA(Gln) amidotransferase subunit A
MASSTDSPGPITKTVSDAAYLLQLLAGSDPFDATTIPDRYLPKPKIKNLNTIRIGIPQEYLLKEMRPEVKQLILDAAKSLEKLGAKVEPMSLIDPHYAIGVYTILQRSEVSSNLARYDGIRYGHERSAFSLEAKRRMLLGTFSLSTGYYDRYYQKAQKVRTLIVNDYLKAFRRYTCLLGPTSPGPALKVGASKDQPMFGEIEDMLLEASSIAGLTGFSLPCGFVDDLPVGLQLTGPQRSEADLIQIASLYQQATSWHLKKPTL